MFEMPVGVEFADDLDVALDPNEFQDPSLPLPIAGNFGVRIKKAELKKKYGTDEVVLVEGQYPVIRFSEVEIVTPEEQAGRSVYVPFQEFGTKPYMEKDFNAGGRELWTNNMAKILRSHDASISFRGVREALAIFEQLTSQGAVFHVQLDYLAEDRKWIGAEVKAIEAAREQGALSEEEAKKQLKEVRYKQGRLEGIRNFVNKETGIVDPVFVGPSGDEIEARTVIRKWISTAQLDRFKLGLRKELQARG